MNPMRALLSGVLGLITGLILLHLIGCAGLPQNNCMQISQKTMEKCLAQKYICRYVVGTDDRGVGHRWVERYEDGKWLVWDPAISYVRKSYYTAEELGYKTTIIGVRYES